MSFEDALKKVDSGTIIDIEVTPGSKSLCVPSGYNSWRKRIEVRLSQNARKGKANEQLIESLAGIFGVKAADVSIVNGMHNSKKSLLVKGIDYSSVVDALKLRLPEN